MSDGNGSLLVVLALLTAFAVSFVAVAQHVRCVSLGYRCDRAEQRQRELLRRRALVRGRLARCRAPGALLDKATEFALDLGYPRPAAPATPGTAMPLFPVAQLAPIAGARGAR